MSESRTPARIQERMLFIETGRIKYDSHSGGHGQQLSDDRLQAEERYRVQHRPRDLAPASPSRQQRRAAERVAAKRQRHHDWQQSFTMNRTARIERARVRNEAAKKARDAAKAAA